MNSVLAKAEALKASAVSNLGLYRKAKSDMDRQFHADAIESAERKLVDLALGAGLTLPYLAEYRHPDNVHSYGSAEARQIYRELFPMG